MDLKITKDKLKAAWEFSAVRILLTLVAAVAVFYTVFQITRPVVPAEQRFDILHGGVYLDEGEMLWEQELLDGITVGQKEINFESMTLDDFTAYNASMVIVSRMTAQEGDIFIIPYMLYQSLAQSDNLVNLEDPIPGDPEGRSVLDRLDLPTEISVEDCRITVTTTAADGTESTAREICGLNMTQVIGLAEVGIAPEDYVLCIPDYSTVDYENIVRVVQWIVDEKMDYEDPYIAAATIPAEETTK